jgi:hypothetical protein
MSLAPIYPSRAIEPIMLLRETSARPAITITAADGEFASMSHKTWRALGCVHEGLRIVIRERVKSMRHKGSRKVCR